MNFTEYAKNIGKSNEYVHKLFKEGRLNHAVYIDEYTGSKRIDPKIADKIFRGENLFEGEMQLNNQSNSSTLFDDSQILEQHSAERLKKKKAEFQANLDSVQKENSSTEEDETSEYMKMTFDQARRKKVYYEAEFEKFKVQREKGKYVLKDDALKEAFRAGLLIREKVYSIPGQISSILSDMSSAFEIKNLLLEYLDNAFNEACGVKPTRQMKEKEESQYSSKENDEESESEFNESDIENEDLETSDEILLGESA